MANIYDDVELLKEQIATLIPQTLTEGADLHTLTVGRYYIPTTAISATIVNKPSTANTATAIVNVESGGNNGQLMITYIPCDKDSTAYYQCVYYQNTWGSWHEVNVYDSGWIDLPLTSGITAYSVEQAPRYRKIGNELFLSGVLRGLTTSDTTVATLPAGFRPSKKHIVPCASVGQMFAKWTINTNGTIVYNRATVEPLIAENWHSIACNISL